jgi:hypothetical protein
MRTCSTTGGGNTHQTVTRPSMPHLKKKIEIKKGNWLRPGLSATCKKSSDLLREAPKMKYELIKNNPEHPVAKWAEILQIERTGYYAWVSKRVALETRRAL